MDAQQSKGKEKVHYRDSTSEDSDTMPEDVPGQNHHAFWKIRDKDGWKHGTMVDGNRQHWKCNYCSMTGHSGGVSGLKLHLVGYKRRVKKCRAVPEAVSAEMKKLMAERKEKRQKRAALKDCSSVLGESAQGFMVLAHVPGRTCYCYFCTLERAKKGPEYEEKVLRLLHRKMAQVVDAMLSAVEQLSAEEQSLTMTK